MHISERGAYKWEGTCKLWSAYKKKGEIGYIAKKRGCAHRGVHGKGRYVWEVCTTEEGRKMQMEGMHS